MFAIDCRVARAGREVPSLREGVAAGTQYRHEHGGGMHFTALRVVNRYRGSGVIDEHLLAGAVLLPQHQVELFQPSPVEIAESAIAIAVRMALTPFLPQRLQRQVLVLSLIHISEPTRLGMI